MTADYNFTPNKKRGMRKVRSAGIPKTARNIHESDIIIVPHFNPRRKHGMPHAQYSPGSAHSRPNQDTLRGLESQVEIPGVRRVSLFDSIKVEQHTCR